MEKNKKAKLMQSLKRIERTQGTVPCVTVLQEKTHTLLGIAKGSRNKILEPDSYKGKVII